ncbi:MAG TPA: SurA N-terminal domain-containing protein, partial [Campylobacterales bacterium]|nr:SurA N-terminal domain-containing protein [Campylobacterales bacterium]
AAACVLNAGVVDGVALTVNGKVVTMYEIVKFSEQKKVSRKDAIEALIEQRLEEAELSKQNIQIDDFDVERRIEQIAASNKMTLAQFQDALSSRLISYSEYKADVKNKMARERLFQKITYQKFAPIDEKDLKLYYENNKQEFSTPSKIEAVQYSSKDKNALARLMASPMSNESAVAKEEISIDTKTLDPSLVYILKNTKDGSFTQILPLKDEFISFYIKDKKDFSVPDFESVRNEVNEKMAAKKEEDAIKDYFEKLKASAKVKVIRLPN